MMTVLGRERPQSGVEVRPAAMAAFERLEADTNFLAWRDDEIDEKLARMRKTVLEFLSGCNRVLGHDEV